MISSQFNKPLSDDELAELDTFLLEGDASDRLQIDEAHGYLSSLIIGGEDVGTAEWLTDIWGELECSDERKARVTELFLRLYYETELGLREEHPFEPLVIEEEEEGELYEVYDGWCFGFMLGVANHEKKWSRVATESQDLLAPIATLALLHRDEDHELSEDEYTTCVELLPGSVFELYRMFASTRN